MDGSQGSASNSPAPFLIKTYDMVDDLVTDAVISWSHTGRSFVVWNPPEFAQDLLPKYFKHNNFSSFVRQLNTYGFRKVDPDQWEFANEEFLRGHRHLLKNIYRRKPIHSHSLQNQGNNSSLSDSERQEFEKEIKRLTHDKSLLQLELQRKQREKQEFECQIVSFRERLRVVDSRQMQLMTFLAQAAMQKPSFASILTQQTDYHSKKRRLLNATNSHLGFIVEESQLLTQHKDNPDGIGFQGQMSDSELTEKLDSSLKFWEDFLHEVGKTLEKVNDSGALTQPWALTVTELSGSPADEDLWSPISHPSSPNSRDDPPSSPELAGCVNNYANSPTPPPSYIDFDASLKPAGASGLEAIKQAVSETINPPVSAGTNDNFWQNFLTEAPDPSMP